MNRRGFLHVAACGLAASLRNGYAAEFADQKPKRVGLIGCGWYGKCDPFGSPRALLQGFIRTMDAAEANDAQLADALEYLDLDNVPRADRAALGGKLAAKLQAVLRKLTIDLSAISNDWNAPLVILGEAQGVRLEIFRKHL